MNQLVNNAVIYTIFVYTFEWYIYYLNIDALRPDGSGVSVSDS